ncbi:hypothetical protein SOV_22200 [Sporomusa ovata DSM 2662]|uniref:Zinc-ribbon domain-containing protein n=1 Tax=Sporomusa ovata TaxID=2378 RepID=A0A0U1L330_9FIRM|nr:APC family permease [Sporomusa ovata]EQB25537.1 hypothetical protein SOV_4c01990 [Sporomusa ovata DSM 2662]CQR74101.1 hypothetical protein SpAn4DRAFT_0563 [Sporomusa ovata]
MQCPHCGETCPENEHFCTFCGGRLKPESPTSSKFKARPVGFSSRINDPAFARYVRHTNLWSAIFAGMLAVAAIIGFTIAGEVGSEMENPESMFIGLGIGGMFLVIALLQIMGRKKSRTWDGTVVNKEINYGRDKNGRDYTEYVVVVEDERGKKYCSIVKDDDTRYNYFQIGDRLRHHAGLNSYEKYDKSQDSVIFCNACGDIWDIEEDVCPRCKCPLLK